MKIRFLKINQFYHILLSIKIRLMMNLKILNKMHQFLLLGKKNSLIKQFQIIMII